MVVRRAVFFIVRWFYPSPPLLDSSLRWNDELRGRSDEGMPRMTNERVLERSILIAMTRCDGGRPAAFCRTLPRVPTRDTPTVVLASGGTPKGNTGPAS